MKEKIIKIFNIIVIMFVVIGSLMISCNKSYAATDIIDDFDMWKPKILNNSGFFGEKIGAILGIFNGVGVIVSVCTLALIGLKFILGSAEGKAQYKQTMIPWLIGTIIICLSVTTIPNIIYNFLDTNFEYGDDEIAQYSGKNDAKKWIEEQWKPNGEDEQQIRDKITEIEGKLENSKKENDDYNKNYYQEYLNELKRELEEKIERETTNYITLSRTSLILSMPTEKTYQLTAKVYPTTSKEPLSWSSSDNNVATVKDGKIQAVGEGTTQITATSGTKVAICTVKVEKEKQFESGRFSYYYHVKNKTVLPKLTEKNYYDNSGTILEMGFVIDVPDGSLIKDLDKIPLIVKLHGGGGFSNKYLLDEFIPNARLGQEKLPAIVLYPCKTTSTNVAWTKYNEAVIGIINWVIKEYNIDENKISLAGFSRGGGRSLANRSNES